jgi:peptidoglycan/LPS O-acetylase OafA/YrhL
VVPSACSIAVNPSQVLLVEPKPKLSKAHIPALDGVRAIAIVAVLLAHTLPDVNVTGIVGAAVTAVASAGAFGVDLFFVLSGFLITGILLDADKGTGYFKNFYARRILRLFPLYYTYLLLLMTVVPFVHHMAHSSMPDFSGNWWWYLAYFSNWKNGFAVSDPYLSHFWSLAVEEQFYLVWPTVVLLTPRRYLAWVCGLLILSANILRGVWSHDGVYWNQIYRLTVTRWDTLALGALAALAMRSTLWRPLATKAAQWLMILGIGAWLGIAFWQQSIDWANPTIQTYGATLASIGFTGLTLYAATVNGGAVRNFLQRPLMLSLGKYSYGMYVIHVLIFMHIEWVDAYFANILHLPAVPVQVATLILSNVVTYMVAALSWRFLEAPILKLKDRFV